MNRSHWIRPARLADAAMLYDNLPVSLTGKTKALWQQQLRSLFELCSGQVMLLGRHDAQAVNSSGDKLVKSADLILAGIQTIEAGRAILHLLTSKNAADERLMHILLEYIFYELDIFRLELLLTADELRPDGGLAGWEKEAVLRQARYNSEKMLHQDVMMYVLLRPRYKGRGAAFVLFPRGILAIYGTESYVLETGFAHFGSAFSKFWQQEAAQINNLLDDKGELRAYDELKPMFQARGLCAAPNLPQMVKKAAIQAGEYFSGNRKDFQLEFYFQNGSRFQKKVWLALADIPFGATWSYEEMAEYISADDERDKAKKLSRAVGSACAANPMSLFLPCHRVIGKDGKLTGFGGGLDIKEYLLEHEMFAY